ncbi:hypothetical protein VDGL01_10377 [Verticillium dahliae]
MDGWPLVRLFDEHHLLWLVYAEYSPRKLTPMPEDQALVALFLTEALEWQQPHSVNGSTQAQHSSEPHVRVRHPTPPACIFPASPVALAARLHWIRAKTAVSLSRW